MRDFASSLIRGWYRWPVQTLHYHFSNSPAPFNQSVLENISVINSRCNPPVGKPDIHPRNISNRGDMDFVADPFVYVDEALHVFFEVYDNNRNPTAAIGHAVSKDQGNSWQYSGTVIEPERHASFPFVFEHENEIFMMPDLANREGDLAPVRLYRASDFPHEWVAIQDILNPDHACKDTVVFRKDDRWWAVTGSGNNDQLRLYHNDRLIANGWTPHVQNPVVTDRMWAARPAGRPILKNNRIYLPLQDCEDEYGSAVRLYEVTQLTPEVYEDEPVDRRPLLRGSGGRSWNSGRMHHLDYQEFGDTSICAVDGDVGFGRNFFEWIAMVHRGTCTLNGTSLLGPLVCGFRIDTELAGEQTRY